MDITKKLCAVKGYFLFGKLFVFYLCPGIWKCLILRMYPIDVYL